MALYRVRTKRRKCCNGVNIEPGMEVQVVTPLNNTVQVNNWQYVEDAFLRVFGISLRKANCLNVSDLDYDTLDSLKKDHQVIMTLEDGELQGGYGVNVASYFVNSNIKVLNYGITKKFHTDFKAEELLAACGMSIPKLVNDVKNYL